MKPSLFSHDLSCRSPQAELMDAPIGSPEKYDDIIRQIEKVNALTGGYRPVLAWLKRQAKDGRPFTVVDLGCGRGSLLRAIAKHFRRSHLTGLDVNPLAIEAAHNATPDETAIEYHLADIFSDDLPDADFIICSHTTHHMTDAEIVKLLRMLDMKAKRGWFICDLHRHKMAHLFTQGILTLLPIDPMVAHDGPLSVCRAFNREEWQTLIYEARLTCPVQITWHFPFRYGVSARKDWI